jgi:hypothetical protein
VRPPGEHTGLVDGDEELEFIQAEALRPEQAPTEGPGRLVLDEDPARSAVHKGGAAGKALHAPIGLSPAPPDEGSQLGLEEGLLLLVLYFFFPPRAP